MKKDRVKESHEEITEEKIVQKNERAEKRSFGLEIFEGNAGEKESTWEKGFGGEMAEWKMIVRKSCEVEQGRHTPLWLEVMPSGWD